MRLDGGTFLLQWAAGGLLAGWTTTRLREVGIGYGWLLRITYGVMAVAAAAIFASRDGAAARLAMLGAVLCVAGALLALAVSVARRAVGVRGQVEGREHRRARVRAMLGSPPAPGAVVGPAVAGPGEAAPGVGARAREFPPALDLVAPIAGFAGLLAAADLAGGPYLVAALRLVVGAAFIGAVSDAMLLGHWYLVQPGLRRDPVRRLVVLTAWLWPVEVAVFLLPDGMVQVLTGAIDDGSSGLLGWVWAVCAVTTGGLLGATWLALRERFYSAVMAATGLLYLAILTAFGVDLVARAVLAP